MQRTTLVVVAFALGFTTRYSSSPVHAQAWTPVSSADRPPTRSSATPATGPTRRTAPSSRDGGWRSRRTDSHPSTDVAPAASAAEQSPRSDDFPANRATQAAIESSPGDSWPALRPASQPDRSIEEPAIDPFERRAARGTRESQNDSEVAASIGWLDRTIRWPMTAEPSSSRWPSACSRAAAAGSAVPSCLDGTCPPGTCPIESGLWDNTYLFALYDGFDLNVDGTRHGGRFGVNWGFPPFDDYFGLGLQLGVSGSTTNEDEQVFATGGVFWRGDVRFGRTWNMGAVVDFLHDGFVDVDVTQVRAKTSYTWNLQNEIGVWGAAAVSDDDFSDSTLSVEAVDQANLYWRHLWANGLDGNFWVGWRNGQRGTEPDNSDGGAAIGTDLNYPLGEIWAITGGGHYAVESETWNVFAGVGLYLGGRARQQYLGQYRHLPYFGVADNSTMTLTIDK